MSEQKPICIICNGKYAFASETAFGLRPNIMQKDMPNVFICWECVHALQEEFNKHIHNFSYSLLFTLRKSDMTYKERVATSVPISTQNPKSQVQPQGVTLSGCGPEQQEK